MNRYKTGGPSKATPTTLCQKCLKKGHYSYECTSTQQDRPYVSRPSRSQQFHNPKLAPKISAVAPEPKAETKKLESNPHPSKSPKRGRPSHSSERDEAKRRRSISTDSVSTISTNRSKSRSPPPRKRRPSSPRSSRPKSAKRDDPRSLYSSRSRNYRTRDASPPPRGNPRDRSPSRDPSPPPRRRRSPDYARRRDVHSRSRSRSRSRSPYRGGREPDRDTRREPVVRPAPTPPPAAVRKERSLSPYSQRVALTKGMNG